MHKRICCALLGWSLAISQAAASEVAGLADVWNAIYMNDAKVGYMHSMTDQVEAGGQKVVHSRVVMEVTIRRFTDQLKITAVTDEFEMADGRLYAIDSQMLLAKEVQRTRGRLQSDGTFVLTIQKGGTQQTQTIPWNKDVKGPYAHERALRDTPLKPGEKRVLNVFMPEFNLISTRTLTALNWEQVKLNDGQTHRLLAVEDANDQIPQKGKFWVDAEGNIQKGELPVGGLVMAVFRVSRSEALEESKGGAVDLGYTTLVRTDRPIPNAHSARAVTYRLEFSDKKAADTIPQASYQSILAREGDTLRLRVGRTEPSPEAQPAEPPGAEFLESNGFIQSDDPEIVALAKQLTANVDDPWGKVQALEKWVDKNMTNKDFTIAFADASEVIRTRQGDCTEHAVLLAALCRAVGVPSRVAMGLVYLEGTGSFGYHMWTEVFVKDQWYALDGTLGQGFIGGGHIKISDGSLKGASALSTLFPIFNVMGKMKIYVEKIE